MTEFDFKTAQENLLKKYSNKGKNSRVGTYLKVTEFHKDVGDFASTGLIGLDLLMGGGIPRRKLSQALGDSGTGKTTLALQCLKAAQKRGEGVAFIDLEYTLDRKLARGIGIDMEQLLVAQPESGEDAMDIIFDMHREGVTFFVLDSLGAFVPESKIESEDMRKSIPALRARLIGDFSRTFIPKLGRGHGCFLAINHLVGTNKSVKTAGGTIEIKEPAGGTAWKYLCSTTLQTSKSGKMIGADGDDYSEDKHGKPWGAYTKVALTRSKTTLQSRSIELLNVLGQGFSEIYDLIETAIALEVIEQKASFFKIPGEDRSIQGKDKMLRILSERPDTQKLIRDTLESMIPSYSDED